MRSKEEILKVYFNPEFLQDHIVILKAMEEYAKEYHRHRISDEHCICNYDQYGGSTNPKCLIHGDQN